ncbi:hypothetical protein [Flavobacterium ovatum]
MTWWNQSVFLYPVVKVEQEYDSEGSNVAFGNTISGRIINGNSHEF